MKRARCQAADGRRLSRGFARMTRIRIRSASSAAINLNRPTPGSPDGRVRWEYRRGRGYPVSGRLVEVKIQPLAQKLFREVREPQRLIAGVPSNSNGLRIEAHFADVDARSETVRGVVDKPETELLVESPGML